ncbi:sigma factor-like helix-turn-helix DNA-binding protein [Streptomyces uncialis]|uniref:sigma factor-like helix-turn-helix DNA-binding protein n=1 Tax=Streptomyces uncialis TaxID=1048205 RepID=UPI0033DA416A
MSEQLVGIARLTDVFDSIGRLPADHRDAVLLHHSYGCDENEVASITGMSEAVVHSHLRHAHRILHDLHIDHIPGAAQ